MTVVATIVMTSEYRTAFCYTIIFVIQLYIIYNLREENIYDGGGKVRSKKNIALTFPFLMVINKI